MVTPPLKNPGYAPGQTKFRDRVSSCITDLKVINIDFSNFCLVPTIIRDGPLEKWLGGGGVGKKPKKIHARENAKKKNSCKEEGKEKKFM